MNVYFEPRKLRLDASAVAIGMFDGVHLGHRHVLAKLRERGDALGVPTVLITFDPHPRSVVRENGAPPMLCRLPERLQLLQDTGAIDHCLVLHFDRQRASEEVEDFARGLLVETLGTRALVVGVNFACGKARRGNVSEMQRFGAAWGFSVHPQSLRPAPPGDEHQAACSSSEVRRLVALGDVEGAARMLGRAHVVRAALQRRGGAAGARLRLPGGMCLPPEGAYAAQLRGSSRGDAWRSTVINILGPTSPGDDAVLARVEDEAVVGLPADIDIRFQRRLGPMEPSPSIDRIRLMNSSHRSFVATSACPCPCISHR